MALRQDLIRRISQQSGIDPGELPFPLDRDIFHQRKINEIETLIMNIFIYLSTNIECYIG